MSRKQAFDKFLSLEHDGIEIVGSRAGYSGFFDLDVLTLRHRRFDGGVSPALRRERLHIGPAVCILPYDPERDAVLLIEQFRTGALAHPGGPWLIECVAGLVEPGEELEETARRELLEEAGLRAERIERIGAYAPTPGAVTEFATMFIAAVRLTGDSGQIHGLASEHEDIKTHVLAADEAFAWVDGGRITAVNAQLPLRWLQLRREELRARWRGRDSDPS